MFSERVVAVALVLAAGAAAPALAQDEEPVDEPAGAVDVQPPSATLSAPPRAAVRTLLRRGLAGTVTCAEPCAVLVELRRGGSTGRSPATTAS